MLREKNLALFHATKIEYLLNLSFGLLISDPRRSALPLLRKMLLFALSAGISLQRNLIRAAWPEHAFAMKIWAWSRDTWSYPQFTSCRPFPEMHTLTPCGMAHLRLGVQIFSRPSPVTFSPQKIQICFKHIYYTLKKKKLPLHLCNALA